LWKKGGGKTSGTGGGEEKEEGSEIISLEQKGAHKPYGGRVGLRSGKREALEII